MLFRSKTLVDSEPLDMRLVLHFDILAQGHFAEDLHFEVNAEDAHTARLAVEECESVESVISITQSFLH